MAEGGSGYYGHCSNPKSLNSGESRFPKPGPAIELRISTVPYLLFGNLPSDTVRYGPIYTHPFAQSMLHSPPVLRDSCHVLAATLYWSVFP